MKQRLAKIHKWIALTFGIFWILQAASGALLVFHRELDDFIITSSASEANSSGGFKGLSIGLEKLKQNNPDNKPLFLLTSGGNTNLFDVIMEAGDGDQIAYRLSADNGKLYKTYYWEGPVTKLGFFRALHKFHTELLSGTVGHWLIGISGVFLAITVGLGLYVGWPRKGTVKHVLQPKPYKSNIPSLYAWHRAVGLWSAFILLTISIAGVGLVWLAPMQDALGISTDVPSAENSVTEKPISLQVALNIAKQYFPDGELAIVRFPQDKKPYYLVRLTQPGESRLYFGETTLHIDQYSGNVLHTYDPLNSTSLRSRFFYAIYPLHTGEFWGIAGRIVYLVTALGLLVLSYLGGSLYLKKIKRKKGPTARSSKIQRSN